MALTAADVEQYAPRLRLTRHTGALLFWFQNTYTFRAEPEKLKPVLVSITVKNLLFGWWSIVSVFVNPAVTIMNWIEFKAYTKKYAQFRAMPEQYIFEARQAEENGTNKKDKQFKVAMTVFLILAAIVALFLIISIIEAGRPPRV